jgi:hypothetical protein
VSVGFWGDGLFVRGLRTVIRNGWRVGCQVVDSIVVALQ